MRQKNTAFYFLITGLVVIIAAGISLSTSTSASAQCGSQASSCKNCHEVQAEKPVNNDGTPWHTSHAFGDFCYICHGGNQQATDKTAAHQGLEAPLSNIKVSCQQCHTADLQERAQVYASSLGVTIGSNTTPPAAGSPGEVTTVSADLAPSVASAQNCNQVVVKDPGAVDYVQQYNEIVLGKQPINLGNSILISLILLLLIGGGGFVVIREKLVSFSLVDKINVDGEYPVDVVEMLPRIAELNLTSRKSLTDFLNNPQKADKAIEILEAVVRKDDK